jgi:hypothetical protein
MIARTLAAGLFAVAAASQAAAQTIIAVPTPPNVAGPAFGPTLVAPAPVDDGVPIMSLPITSLPVASVAPPITSPAALPSSSFSSGISTSVTFPPVATPQLPSAGPAMRPEAVMSPETLAMLSQTARTILIEALPEEIEKKDDWGETRERLSQLKLKNDGLKLRFEKTTKPVNHGLWKQLVVVPVDPMKNLQFRILEARGNGSVVAFQVLVHTPLVATARVERWRTGVKMLNFSTEADATIEMRVAGELQYGYTTEGGTKYLTLRPRVTAVDVKLIEFDLRRISKAAGPLVHDLGDMLTDPLADQLDKHEPKITEKVNKSIAKRQDRLKIPVSLPFDFSGWSWGGKS